MKRLLYSLFIVLSITASSQLQGNIVDESGRNVQMEQGAGHTRIRMDELSWSSTPIPFYLNVKQDGSYINNKVFAAQYRMTPIDGPFYPMSIENAPVIDVGGETTVDFTVVPYLNVEWVSEPALTADNKITATFRFTKNPAPAGLTQPAMLDYQLFISTTQYVGNNNFDATIVTAVKPVTNAQEAQDITIVSNSPMKYATTFYVRVGVRVNDSFKKYNYTDIKTVVAP